MVTTACWIVLGASPSAEATGPVRSALAKGHYPWYDAPEDTVKPVWPPREWNLKLDWLDRLFGHMSGIGSAGNLITFGLTLLLLTVLVLFLLELWRRYQPSPADRQDRADALARLAPRIEGLPAGVRPETDDPWDEAIRRRAAGDFAGAVVCLFAHQLLTLDRLRMLRLAPGRTGRQLIRTVEDRELRGWVEPTLRLFEAVYYGHHVPSADSFNRVWSLAESFERRIVEGPSS